MFNSPTHNTSGTIVLVVDKFMDFSGTLKKIYCSLGASDRRKKGEYFFIIVNKIIKYIKLIR
jgi:hypothetical protein